MKRKFSKSWKSSKQPRKQRKYAANAPLHLKRKLLSVNLSKELRKKYSKRNIPLRKGDIVKIMRGKFKGKQGKVTEVRTKMEKIFIEKVQIKKRDGSSVNVPLKASNLQITELNTEDRKRKLKISIHSSGKQINERMKKFTEEKVTKIKKNSELKDEASKRGKNK
ncbi:50S ribosomal protein L24 [Candidatus Pacearchaeota archaeon]|nr:50S ribosomal protein L24 [Candidatus Pacearchaeota archaeon]